MVKECFFKRLKDLEDYKDFLNKILFSYCSDNPGWIYDFTILKVGRMWRLDTDLFQY
jgi:hypothetical protein